MTSHNSSAEMVLRNAQVWTFHSYCADHRLRWEERSDAYWEVVEHAARAYREHGLWGAAARTQSGPVEPVWHEYPERLRRANAVFLGEEP